jgi:dynein intermediate chain 1
MYDLSVSKYRPICEQQVVKKTKLTHLAFNSAQPMLLVGDDHGTIVSMKLSPNLRKAANEPSKEEQTSRLVEVLKVDIIEVF